MHSASSLIGVLDADAVAVQIFERLVREVPLYDALTESDAASVLAICRRNVDLIAPFLDGGRRPSDEDLDELRASAQLRATQGIPLEDLLHAYRVGGRVILENLWSALADDPELLLRTAAGVLDHVDAATTMIVESYLAERGSLSSEYNRQARLLVATLAGSAPLTADDERLAEHLGVSLRAPFIVFAARVLGGSASARTRLVAQLRRIGVLAYSEPGAILAVAPSGTEPQRACGEVEGIVAGRSERAELGLVIEDALALAASPAFTGCRWLEDLFVERLIVRNPDLIAEMRGRISEALTPSLEATLAAVLASGLDRAAAARMLGVHRNTLSNRLAQIEQRCGLSLARSRDLIIVGLAFCEDAPMPASDSSRGSGEPA